MPRYFFHLETQGDAIRDEEGVEADDPDHAVKEAHVVLREMRAGGELGSDEDGWTLVVEDDQGNEVRRITL